MSAKLPLDNSFSIQLYPFSNDEEIVRDVAASGSIANQPGPSASIGTNFQSRMVPVAIALAMAFPVQVPAVRRIYSQGRSSESETFAFLLPSSEDQNWAYVEEPAVLEDVLALRDLLSTPVANETWLDFDE
jgi:hypothetical protein